jgi:Brp/Blh family beta-carotene 15,15'-monooxygenase
MLILFLIVAAYHFGKEDCWGGPIKKSILNPLKFFLKGSLVIWVPLWLNFNETLIIFDILGIKNKQFYIFLDMLNNNYLLLLLIIVSLLSNILITKNLKQLTGMFIDTIAIIVLYDAFSPLVAFTIYFCFLHSIRHSASLINELKINLNIFIKKALPLTVLTTLIFLLALYNLTGFQEININNSIINVIFIGLASLTFPHILLEYLIEKNEK